MPRAGSGQAHRPQGSRKHGGLRKGLEARELQEAQGRVGKGQIHVFTEFSFSRLCFLTKGDVTLKGEKRYWFLRPKNKKAFLMDKAQIHIQNICSVYVVLTFHNGGWRGGRMSRKENV